MVAALVAVMILVTGIFSYVKRENDAPGIVSPQTSESTVEGGYAVSASPGDTGTADPDTVTVEVGEDLNGTVNPDEDESGVVIADSNDVITDDAGEGSEDINGIGDINETDTDGTGDVDVEVTTSEPTDVESLLASMTLHEKVCQMIISSTFTLTGERKLTTAGASVQNALAQYPVGGIIFDSSNFISTVQTMTMISTTQSYSDIPLIVTLDEEGGRVARLMSTLGTTRIGPMLQYKDLGQEAAIINASIIASDIRSYGFNLDLAPVADVWSNPQNTVIGDRAYSDDFSQAADLVSGAVLGFHSQGVACTLKHFPGHGDSSADSHYGAVYIYKSMDDIRREELLPFAAGINAGADCVMIGHLIISDLGDEPALFNRSLVTGVLRNELGFRGIIMTDSLQMKALTDYYGVSETAVRAVQAGCDILLMPSDLPTTVSALETAVANGTISEARIDESVRRILNLKYRYGILRF